MRILMFALATLTSIALCAAERTPEQIARSKARRAASLAAKGGLVVKPQTGNRVRIVSAQKNIDVGFIRSVATESGRVINITPEVSTMDSSECVFADIAKVMKMPGTGAAVLVVDSKKLPTLLSAPENAWAILNVKPLTSDFAPKAVVESRVKKELSRALACAFNAGQSVRSPCLLSPVFTMTDLDALKIPSIDPEAMSKVMDVARLRDINPVKRASYKQAVMEGWAPAPTNDIQKAIWDEVHQLPTSPIKIKPEVKK